MAIGRHLPQAECVTRLHHSVGQFLGPSSSDRPVCDQPASVARLAQHGRAKRGPRPSHAKTMAHQARSAKKVWQMWCKCGARRPWTRHEEPISAPRTSVTWTFFGADDGIRTRDPHLGKVLESVHPVLLRPSTWTPSVSSSRKCCRIRPVVTRVTTGREAGPYVQPH